MLGLGRHGFETADAQADDGQAELVDVHPPERLDGQPAGSGTGVGDATDVRSQQFG
ncbi:hypothetical protein ABT218_34640 [Streptomyces sp. NPDC001455]|uniref:hypothetical protein n=1 Tax=unclassified Streptomyces TaxID=2593676 RepID=UPI00331DBF03